MQGKLRAFRTIFVLTFSSIFALSACTTVNTSASEKEKIYASAATETTQTSQSTISNLPVYVPGSIKVFSAQEVQDAWELPYLPTKRAVYYQTFGYISKIVGYEESDKFWKNYYARKPERNAEPDQMMIKLFVEYFDIKKEDFAAAVEENRRFLWNLGEEVDTNEENELPNADIIYTFDNEIINYYYRRA